jgi:hypothetical protein
MAVDYRLFKVVFNPTRTQLTPGPKPNCYGCSLGLWRDRVEGVDAIALGTWRPPRSSAELRVPDVPPGRYLVALFDGSESADHYTWDFIRVVGESDEADGIGLVFAIAAGFLLLTIAGVFGLRVTRRI